MSPIPPIFQNHPFIIYYKPNQEEKGGIHDPDSKSVQIYHVIVE